VCLAYRARRYSLFQSGAVIELLGIPAVHTLGILPISVTTFERLVIYRRLAFFAIEGEHSFRFK